jgi:periplasmic protein TonB
MKGLALIRAFPLSGSETLPVVGEKHPLRREFSKWMSVSNGISLLVGILIFAGWFFWTHREKDVAVNTRVKIVRYQELGVPPSIAKPTTPQVAVAQVVPPSIGVPEPVPDIEAPDTKFATQAQMNEALQAITMGDLQGSGNDSLVVNANNLSPSPEDFVAVEDEPRLLRIEPPQYPQLAREAGVEGTVVVRALVGKDGKVKKTILISGNPILADAALECGKTAIFTPAMQQKKPVEVWIQLPIEFTLK